MVLLVSNRRLRQELEPSITPAWRILSNSWTKRCSVRWIWDKELPVKEELMALTRSIRATGEWVIYWTADEVLISISRMVGCQAAASTNLLLLSARLRRLSALEGTCMLDLSRLITITVCHLRLMKFWTAQARLISLKIIVPLRVSVHTVR